MLIVCEDNKMLKLLITLLLVHYLNATCDVCQPGRAACHSENTYSICVEGRATRALITCPVGHTCTGEKFICYPKDEGYQPICKSGDIVPIETSTSAGEITTEDTTPTATTPGDSTSGGTTPVDTDFRNFCTKNGDGSYTNENDSTCKSFIWCFSGRGEIDFCQKVNKKATYFNGITCDVLKPEYCT